MKNLYEIKNTEDGVSAFVTLNIVRKPVDLGLVLDEEFNTRCRSEERLALSAPKLYNALRDLINSCENSGDDDALKRAKDAIKGI